MAGKNFINNLLKVSTGVTFNKVYVNNTNNNNILNARFGANYSPKLVNPKIGKLNFTASLSYTQKLKAQNTSNVFNEFTGNVGINYNF
jgi:hypothetical protein